MFCDTVYILLSASVHDIVMLVPVVP